MKQQDQLEGENQSAPTESLADLPLTHPQAELTKAGTGGATTGTYTLTFNGQTTR